jgi:hypothetical protein
MSKAKLIIGMMIAGISMNIIAAERIPDPTVQIMTPPAGLPGEKGLNPIMQVPVYNELNIQGVFISENNFNKNKVFMNGGFYKIGDVVGDIWKVKSITRKKVVVQNTENKQIKNLNISGD